VKAGVTGTSPYLMPGNENSEPLTAIHLIEKVE